MASIIASLAVRSRKSEVIFLISNLGILAIILLGVGFGSGWILGGYPTIDEGEIAPQPVRILLSGMTIVAIAVLLLVNLSAEVNGIDTEEFVEVSPKSAMSKNQTVQVELSGDTQAVVGKLANQTVKVTIGIFQILKKLLIPLITIIINDCLL
ncbi:hypothetical protein ACP6PL_09980 [Dapis sp. BLCC M126]|uniref:hypothetical protein n=1 Tax=Dapis sp. BLCC M126 TaxID=3400189 RepID=UPI003CE6A702